MLCFGLTCSIFSHLLLVHWQVMMIRGMHGQHKFKFWAFSTDSRSSLSMAASIDGSLYFNTHRHNARFTPAKYWVHRSHMPPSRTSICFLHALTICSYVVTVQHYFWLLSFNHSISSRISLSRVNFSSFDCP